MPSEDAFADSAIQGICLAMFLAFLMLLFSTMNIYQSILSIMCVGLIIVSILCAMVLEGWQLGISEALIVVIAVGLSVDYVIHLSTSYQHSAYKSRELKMKQAYSEMGVSILSGTLTSAGSGVFLFFNVLTIYHKFAVVIALTVFFSYMVSMLLFGAILMSIGPENGAGDIMFCKSKRNNKVKQHESEKI